MLSTTSSMQIIWPISGVSKCNYAMQTTSTDKNLTDENPPAANTLNNKFNFGDYQFTNGDCWRLGDPHFSSESDDDSESTGKCSA